MASDRPGDWRQPARGKPQAPRSNAPQSSRRAWQPGGESQAPARRKRSRGLRLFLAGVFTSAVIALAVWVIWLFWPARYPQLAVVGSIPAESLALPGDAAGANAAAEIAAWAGEGNDRDRPKLDQAGVVRVDAGGPKVTIDAKAKNLIVYVTAPGGADAEGPYLWVAPADARSAADAFKLRVRDVLDRVSEARRGQPTLLVFDCTRTPVSWPHGLLFNDFARALKELDGDIAKCPGLAVVCASDDDQRSGVIEERKVSAFAYYFLEAIKGAGHGPGYRVTAASAFDHAKAEVERWAVAVRNEKQTPVLLPAAEGHARAEKIDLSAAPPEGYPAPPPPEAPVSVPSELEAAWKTANELAAQVPPPEANNPGAWREYLDLLVRWEHLFRLGANTTAARDRVNALATQLRNPSAGRELAAVPLAVPAGRALGRAPAFPNQQANDQFRSAFLSKVWGAATPAERTQDWAALLRQNAGRETAVRTVAADLAVARLVADGPTPENLATADAVLATTHGNAGLPAPAEAHFVRMLHRHLDPAARPDPALLKQAIALRREAEEAAWVFMALPTEYPYPEYVFPWVRGHVESGDRDRQLGQDLLFSADAKDWKEAEGYFEKARADYARARADGRKVAAALAARDRVFARLPYYARWLAGYHGNRPQTEIDRLLDLAAAAARAAHNVAEMTAKSPPPLAQLDQLDKFRADADGHFKAIADVFDADIAALTNTPLPSNWHALDSALSVPFVPARRRAELLGYLRHVSYQLELNRQQPDGSKVPPPQAREVAARNGRMALAMLNDTTADRHQLIDRPDPSAWWKSFRAAGDQIGDRFRALATEAKAEADKATRTPTLKEAGPPLAAAALDARLTDAAAPMPAGSDPVATDLRFRRHELLLWHARRVTTEGWADVAPTTPDGWYCRKVAGQLVASAESIIRDTAAALAGRPVENMSPAELDRWLADCRAESARRPVVLALAAIPDREVADEPTWDFAFTLSAKDADRPAVGFPVSWLDAPGDPYPRPEPGKAGRRVEGDFVRGNASATRQLRFTATGPPRDVEKAGRLTSVALYRGHLYQNPTEVTLVGTPTREWIYTPPSGDACFAIRAGHVAGAVTILIDLTESMNLGIESGKYNDAPTRLQEAKKGLEQILRDMPNGTTVTVAFFYGTGNKLTAERLGHPVVMDTTNWKTAFAPIRDLEATGQNTPLAGAIREVLSKDNAKKFWPADFTGARTLIVLTDGADNWGNVYKEEPGNVALAALKNTADDVNLHVVFFGLGSAAAKKEQEEAAKQFEVLTRPEHFRHPERGRDRTPAQLWTDVRDAKTLAELVRRAMLPQFPFSGRKQVDGRVEATIPDEGGAVRSTPPLPPGVYDIWGLRAPQAVQLFPADRVLVQARRDNDRFELYLPTYGYETAEKWNRPKASTGTAATGGIRGAVPELKLTNGSLFADLSMAMTLEPIGERKAATLLQADRPRFVWFDADYEDGRPAEKGLNPCVRIENRWPLWAPGWNVTVSRWAFAGAEARTVCRPILTGYWLDGFPGPSASFPVNLNDIPGSLARLEKSKVVRVRENDVTLLGISKEKFAAPGLPEGEYLTVRMKYGKPGEFVFLRPGNLKGGEQPYQLYERHVYYDLQGRYTVRFGPIFDTDPNKDITLDLYAVADLKEASVKASRSVGVRLPVAPLPSLTMPKELEILPRKE